MSNSDSGGKGPPIVIKMFGGFEIKAGNASISDSLTRTRQLWHLIEYLITFRNKNISQDELIEALWPNYNIDNPANALKNLVYRVRSTFSSYNIPYAKEMIVYSLGGYQWNNSLNTVVDVEHFEKLCGKASGKSVPDDTRVKNYLAAINLYTGDFLPGSCYENWVIPISIHYRTMYFNCVYEVIKLLNADRQYQKVQSICENALAIDQLDENTHISLIRALARQGLQAQALAHYRNITDLFFRELGVNPSDAMTSLYHDIIKTAHEPEMSIESIRDDLSENGGVDGAFYCEYEVFKNLYRLEARTAERAGQSIFLSLVTVENEVPGEPLELKIQSKVMDGLAEVIQNGLRKGDVFSRFSAAQYILMLPTLTYENCERVMGRIIKKYKHIYRLRGVSISVRVLPLEPVNGLR